ncbi:hypothetical protein DER45DRAFT_552403 [Fusarium avenaceum]|nr:hypothetical protein DER45DRAFT_552403 [Fusarium avenaceum]
MEPPQLAPDACVACKTEQRPCDEIPSISTCEQLPSYVSEQLGDEATQRAISSRYFQVTHDWLPIISKQRFFHRLDAPTETCPPDWKLLLLCMKLINWLPDASSPQTPLYRAAKRFFLEVELSGIVSLAVLQAAILIAFYEIGHGIFPFANISVGICVRYGAALSIKPRSATSANTRRRSWITDEEQTRIWWALLLLDRFTCLTQPTQSLSMQGPKSEYILPSDDKLWDDDVSPSYPLSTQLWSQARDPSQQSTVASPYKLQHPRSSLVAQATVLLDRVLNRTHHNVKASMSEEETLQLQRTIEDMVEFTHVDCPACHLFGVFGCEVKAILFGSLIALHNEGDFLKPVPLEIPLLIGSELAAKPWEATLPENGISRDQWPPFAVHIIYQAAVSIITSKRDEGYEAVQICLQPFKSALEIVEQRWLSADFYLMQLSILENQVV